MKKRIVLWGVALASLLAGACLLAVSLSLPRQAPLAPPTLTLGNFPLLLTPTGQAPTQPAPTATLAISPTADLSPAVALAQVGKSIFGVEVIQSVNDNSLQHLQTLGVSWLRKPALSWEAVESTPGERNWQAISELESELASASAAGLDILLIVRHTPGWAQLPQGLPHCNRLDPARLPEFAAFLRDVVTRYSQPPFNVRYYELWNEPDVSPEITPNEYMGCFGDESDPFYGGASYAQMLQAVYPIVKQANPDAQIVVGGLLLFSPDTPPGHFLEGILSAGGGDFFDGISYHAYDYYLGEPGYYQDVAFHSGSDKAPNSATKATYLHKILDKYQVSGKYLLATETALLCNSEDTSQCGADFENTKAWYLVHSFLTAQEAGVSGIFWWPLQPSWRKSELLANNNTPLPAYFAYQVLTSQLAGKEFAGRIGASDLGIRQDGWYGYRYRAVENELWVLWSQPGREFTLPTSSQWQNASDWLGQPLALENLQVGSAPVYLQVRALP